jgi:hypothetical protein
MNTNHKLATIGISQQQMAAKTMINSVAWQRAKAKRDKARARGLESLVQKMDKCAHVISAAARGFDQYSDVFENAIVVLLDEVTSINERGVSDTPEELLAPAIK